MKNVRNSLLILMTLTVMVFGQSKWAMDTAHSKLQFKAVHMGLIDVIGSFKDFKINLISTQDDFSDANIEVTIKTASVNTDIEKRDGHLRSADFFDVEKFPEASFKSKSIQKTGESTYQVQGDLTIRDVTKPVQLDVTLKGKAKSPWGQTVIAFQAFTTINRTDWGLKWNRALQSGGWLVSDNIDLMINVEFQQVNS